jgi:replicative DNA helicase
MMASEANVLFNKVKTAKFTNEEWSRLSESANDISKLPLYFADRPGEHVESVVRNAKRLRRKNGGKLGVVLVDYLQLLGSSRKFQVREQEVSYFSRSLMALAHECDVPVLCLSQLNRAVESRADKRPMISDMRESGAIEQDADAIMLVYRDEYYYGQDSKHKGIVEINVAKQRDGETGVRNLAWQGSYIRIANLDNHHDPEDVNDQHWSDR